MTNKITVSEKIQSLQNDILWFKAEYGQSPTTRFVALVAFSSDNPILSLKQLARRKHPTLPDIAGAWIKNSAIELLNQLCETKR